MDKAQIKKFSQYARSTLIPEMQQAISSWKNANIVQGWVQIWNHSYNDSLSLKYSSAVTSLKKQIDKKWEKALAEEAAYIWFNRIVALRFMEVNKYLPTKSSLFSSSDNTWIPEIVKNIANEWNNCGCDKDAINEYVWRSDINSIQELYSLILVSICNKLSEHYWFMFSKIDDWTALLFPRTILNASHILRDKTNGMLNIVDEDWKEVEIIWWIYQYYISEKKDELINASRQKNQKFGKDELWAVTQLFTPRWIVEYMVQNTVWKTWLQNYPNLELQKKWKFYIKWESDTHIKIDSPKELTLLDPACWSWHILVVGFDILFEIYKTYWYMDEDIPELIIKNNLYWFEIDERAHQLACFAVLMKAKYYDKDIEKKVNIWDHIICIWENNYYDKIDKVKYPNLRSFVELWKNWKVYGSLMKMNEVEINREEILKEYEAFKKEQWLFADTIITDNQLNELILQYTLMHNLYMCVVANPPYMWGSNMDSTIKEFVSKEYWDYKSDLFAPFIVKCMNYCKKNWRIGLMTPFTRMYIASYIKLREYILDSNMIESLIQPELHSFFDSAYVSVCTFVLSLSPSNWKWIYFWLENFYWADKQKKKVIEWIKDPNSNFVYSRDQDDFKSIPWNPIIYAASDKLIKTFSNKKIEDNATVTNWLFTCNNNLFLRLWYEIDYTEFESKCKSQEESRNSLKKRYPYNKWWNFRRRYWNHEFVVYFKNFWEKISKYRVDNWQSKTFPWQNNYFQPSISRSLISSSKISVRYYPSWFVFDIAGSSIFPTNKDEILYLLWFMASEIAAKYLWMINPTINYQVWDIKKLPLIWGNKDQKSIISNIVQKNIQLTKEDRDSFETSRNFLKHPLINRKTNWLDNSFNNLEEYTRKNFNELKNNEEELNKIFNKIYWLEWEIDPTVEDKDITIRLADRVRDAKSFLSYIIWCMMWRYSLDQEWLVYAWWDFDKSKYKTFKADDDGIIPILDRDYSDDDIVERTKEFVKKVWWENTLNENLNWIAESLDSESNKTADQVIRDYYNKEFYDNHCQIYQKRPIYWLFVSNPAKPKDSAFKALVYMHRYSETTIQDLRRNYVQNYQQKLLEERARIENNNDKASQKRVAEIDKINTELTAYANKLKDFAETHQWGIDLDDWVKVNYWMFMDADIVAKIKL